MTRTATTVAQMRAQATRDEQMRRTLIGLLDVQRGERNTQLALRRFGWIAFLVEIVFLVGVFLFAVTVALTHWFQSGHLQLPPGSDGFAILSLPMLIWIAGLLQLFPFRYLYASIDELLRRAESDEGRFAPMAALQPTPRSLTNISVEGEQSSPLLRWNGGRVAYEMVFIVNAGFGVGMALFLMSLFIVMIASDFVPQMLSGDELIAFVLFAFVSSLFTGSGIVVFVLGWRARYRADWMRRDLAVMANADGLAWADPAWRTRQQMRLAWRDVRSFSVATYYRDAGGNKWQVYILDGGETRLLWALPFGPSAEQSAVHERLAGLIVGATGLPLRDITQGLVALGAAIRSANPLLQAKAEKEFAATQPTIPGVPVRAMRRWAYGFYGVLAVSLVVTLAYGALSVVAQFVH